MTLKNKWNNKTNRKMIKIINMEKNKANSGVIRMKTI